MKKVICFDVDGTLSEENSWYLLTRSLGASIDDHLLLYQQVCRGSLEVNLAIRELENMYVRTGNAHRVCIQDIFSKIYIRPETYEVFGWLREQDYVIYLVSGGLKNYVADIARRLQVDGWYAPQELLFDHDGSLSRIDYTHDSGYHKVIDLHEIAQRHEIDITDIVFVGDGDNDRLAFEATGKGVAVYTNLEELISVSWKQISHLAELKGIL